MYKKLIILSLPILLAACAAPKYTVEAISEENQSKEITIVQDDATRDVFLDSVQEWCLDTAHKCTLFANQLPMYCSVSPCVSALGGTGYISAVSMKFTP